MGRWKLRLRTITPCGALVFRSAYWLRQTLDLQVRFARPPVGGGSFALPLLRTEMPLQDIPVFRMAYSAPTAHRAVSSETLMLQVRCAHPPMPRPSLLPQPY